MNMVYSKRSTYIYRGTALDPHFLTISSNHFEPDLDLWPTTKLTHNINHE